MTSPVALLSSSIKILLAMQHTQSTPSAASPSPSLSYAVQWTAGG